MVTRFLLKKYPELVNTSCSVGLFNQYKEFLNLSKIWRKNIIVKNDTHNFYK